MLQARQRTAEDGSLVIIYETPAHFSYLYLKAGALYSSRMGQFRHDDMIGKPFGSPIWSSSGRKYIYMMKPSPEWWTLVLSHRTQVLYETDIAVVSVMCNFRSGSVVVEAGTGSGSLTTSIARAVRPNGHVFTFEFHEGRAAQARTEFEKNGISSSLLTVTHRDVCEAGFEIEATPYAADALFLDLPRPWEAIPHALRVMAPGSIFCAFSPCIEQVQKTCEGLRNSKQFGDIRTFECVTRRFEARSVAMRIPDFGSKSGRLMSEEDMAAALRGELTSHARELLRLPMRGIARQQDDSAAVASSADAGIAKAAGEDEDSGEDMEEENDDLGDDGGGQEAQVEPEDEEPADMEADATGDDAAAAAAGPAPKKRKMTAVAAPLEGAGRNGSVSSVYNRRQNNAKPIAMEATSVIASRFLPDMRGHTGYLTFARKSIAAGCSRRL